MRVVGVVAGVNVLRGLPKNRTTIGALTAVAAALVGWGITRTRRATPVDAAIPERT